MKDNGVMINRLTAIFDALKMRAAGDISIQSNGTTLIQRVPAVAPHAWFYQLYAGLSLLEIHALELELGCAIPDSYAAFLSVSNGANLCSSHLAFYGVRKSFDRSLDAPRSPFSILTPNLMERPRELPETKFIVGGYFWDKARITVDSKTSAVECWTPDGLEARITWPSLDVMVASEIMRLETHFDGDGKWIRYGTSTLPY